MEVRKYWDLAFEEGEERQGTDAQLIDEFDDLFRQAVQGRLMADVPLGRLSLRRDRLRRAITGTMSQLMDDPVNTFSVAFEEREANELSYARIVAKAFGDDAPRGRPQTDGVLRTIAAAGVA